QKYSPYDQELGLLSFLAGLLLSMLVARSLSAKLLHGHGTLMHLGVHANEDDNDLETHLVASFSWLILSLLGGVLLWQLPGGSYLLVVPGLVHSLTSGLTGRSFFSRRRFSSWTGWITLSVLCGEVMVLLGWALGFQFQWLYATLGGMLGGFATVLTVDEYRSRDTDAEAFSRMPDTRPVDD
ncbi:MAG: hypothetical protein AAF958_03435, partial [Planctomycetota bacterium]